MCFPCSEYIKFVLKGFCFTAIQITYPSVHELPFFMECHKPSPATAKQSKSCLRSSAIFMQDGKDQYGNPENLTNVMIMHKYLIVMVQRVETCNNMLYITQTQFRRANPPRSCNMLPSHPKSLALNHHG